MTLGISVNLIFCNNKQGLNAFCFLSPINRLDEVSEIDQNFTKTFIFIYWDFINHETCRTYGLLLNIF